MMDSALKQILAFPVPILLIGSVVLVSLLGWLIKPIQRAFILHPISNTREMAALSLTYRRMGALRSYPSGFQYVDALLLCRRSHQGAWVHTAADSLYVRCGRRLYPNNIAVYAQSQIRVFRGIRCGGRCDV